MDLFRIICRQCRNENEKRRRDSFSKLITNLEDILDVKKKSSSNNENNKLDKATILHETVLYLQNHHQSIFIDENIQKRFVFLI